MRLAGKTRRQYQAIQALADRLFPRCRTAEEAASIFLRSVAIIQAKKNIKRGDLFEIILMEVKGGSAPNSSAINIRRLQVADARYRAEAVVLTS